MMEDTVYTILMDGSTMRDSTLQTFNSMNLEWDRETIFLTHSPKVILTMQVSLTWVLNQVA